MMYRITVVDSSNYDLRHYSSMSVFAECGFEIVSHTNEPEKALETALAQQCDMFLCINRPAAVFAAELLKRSARSGINIPTVVISRVNAAGDMRECFLLGAIDYLTEPALEDDIRGALQRAAKAIGKKLMSTEYSKAMKQVLGSLEVRKDNESFIDKLRELLIKTQGTAITVEAAADHFGYNADYFGRYFKSKTGMPFSEFYKNLTISYAKLLLGSGHYKVNEVSEMLGFASADYFTRVFKKVTGDLPSQHKK